MPSKEEQDVLRHRRERAEGKHGTRERVDPTARLAGMPGRIDALADRVATLEGTVRKQRREIDELKAERERERSLRGELDDRLATLQREVRLATPPAPRRG